MTKTARPKLDATQTDRLRGAFLGLFVGDALGTTLEFSSRDSLPHQSEITGGGPFNLRPGDWTDDGAMALALADSLLDARKFDPRIALVDWLAWYDRGEYSSNGRCFDIGNTTRAGLEAFRRTGALTTVPPGPAGRARVPRGTGAGNGGIMRLAPLAVAYALRPAELTAAARAQSECTHPANEASLCAELLATLLTGLALRDDRTDPHALVLAYADVQPLREWRGYDRADVSSSGRARDTLEAALWCVASTHSFEEALVLAVNLADDSDTVGAVTGQIAGALYGADAIPARWWSVMQHRGRLVATAADLCCLAEEEAA